MMVGNKLATKLRIPIVFFKKEHIARAQVPPPGFSMPNRAPPPGFASHERMEPSFHAMSWNPLLDASSHRNQDQALPVGNIGNPADIEFMDPAILAIGKGRLPGGLNNAASLDMRSNFSSQLSAFENEARLQLLMQRSLSPLQNQRYADMGVGFAQGLWSNHYPTIYPLFHNSLFNSLELH